MAYPPSSGNPIQKNDDGDRRSGANLHPHPSLPAKPPQSNHAAPPSWQNGGSRGYAANNAAFGGFMPRSVAARAPAMSAPPSNPSMMTTSQAQNSGGYQSGSYSQQGSYYQQPSQYATATPPQMMNPYTLPGQAGNGYGRNGMYDPETEAQIAEWNSAYAPKDDGKKGNQGGVALTSGANGVSSSGGHHSEAGTPGANSENSDKHKTVVRKGGGKKWQDTTLLEWDPQQPRLFIGNLAGEVTDESLLKAFSKYPSVAKARVIREKRTTKSKGYGFVAFSDPDDYFKAAKEMVGKYIGSHPVTISRANTEIKVTSKPTKNSQQNGRHGKKGGRAGGSAATGAGIQKDYQHKKDKFGPKILG